MITETKTISDVVLLNATKNKLENNKTSHLKRCGKR